MTLLKLGPKFYVNAEQIVALQNYPSRPAQRDKAAAVAEGAYRDATGRDTLRTLVHLQCGMVVGSAIGADALAKRPSIETTVRHSTRGHNLDNAQVVTGADETGAAAIVTIEPPPKTARGRSFPTGAANPQARAVADEEETRDAATAGDKEEGKSGEPKPFNFGRLLGRTDGPR